MTANEKIMQRMGMCNTLLCCGLDPDIRKMPLEITRKAISDEEKVWEFLQEVIDLTAQHVCTYKAQKAFFDVLDGGHELLKSVIEYIHTTYPELSVIVDCKIGDIDNTMDAYIENLFGKLQADGIVVNPYMGDDVLFPLSQLEDKSIVVLVKTSNVSGSIIQDTVLKNGRLLWQHILDLLIERWNTCGNMIPVLSAIADWDTKSVRQKIPEQMPVLLAGVGAQGGGYHHLRELLNKEQKGVFVNSSRSILYPAHEDWRVGIVQATVSLKETLNIEGGRID